MRPRYIKAKNLRKRWFGRKAICLLAFAIAFVFIINAVLFIRDIGDTFGYTDEPIIDDVRSWGWHLENDSIAEGFTRQHDEYSFDPYFSHENDYNYTFYPGESFNFNIDLNLDAEDFLRQLPFDEFASITPFTEELSHDFLAPVIAMIPGVVVDWADPLAAIEEVMLVLFDVLTQQALNGHTNFYNAIYDALFIALRAELLEIRRDIDTLLGTGSSSTRNNRLVNNLNARLNGLPARIINNTLNVIMDDVFGAIDEYHPELLGRTGLIFNTAHYTFPYVRTRLNQNFNHLLNGTTLLGVGQSSQTIRNRLLTVTGTGTGMQVTAASIGGALGPYVYAIVSYQQPRPHRPTRSYSVAQRRARLIAINNALSAASIDQALSRSMTGWIMSRLDLQPFVVSSWQELRAAVNDINVVPHDGTPVTLYIAAVDVNAGIQGVTSGTAAANLGPYVDWVNGRQGFTTGAGTAMQAGAAATGWVIALHAGQNVTLRNYAFVDECGCPACAANGGYRIDCQVNLPAVIIQNSNNGTLAQRRHFSMPSNTFLTLDNVVLMRTGTGVGSAASAGGTSRFAGGGVTGLPTGAAAVAREENPDTRRVHFENGGRILVGPVTAQSQMHHGGNAANQNATAINGAGPQDANGVPISLGIGGTITGLNVGTAATWSASGTTTAHAFATNPNGSDIWLNGTRGLIFSGNTTAATTSVQQHSVNGVGKNIVLTSYNPNVTLENRARILDNRTLNSGRRTWQVNGDAARFSFENVIIDSTTNPMRIIGGVSVPGANAQVNLFFGATISRISTGDSGAIQNTSTSVVNMFCGAELLNNRAGAGSGAIIVGYVNPPANAANDSRAVFNMHGGLIADNINQYPVSFAGGGQINNNNHRGLGGGVLMGQGNNVFNMHGGEIRNNQTRFTSLTGTGDAAVYTRRSSSSGGGVAIDGNSTFNWFGGRIHSNRANNGGAIAIIGAPRTAARPNITAEVNIDLQDWGAPEWAHLDQIDPERPYIPVFTGNHVAGNGGFLVMTHAGVGRLNIVGEAIIRGNTAGTVFETLNFDGNSSTQAQLDAIPRGHGGAIAMTGGGQLHVDGALLQSNEARNTGGGAAVASTGSIHILSDTVLEDNRAGISVWELQGSNIVETPERIVNAAGNGGGASVTLQTGSLVIASNAIIRDNTAQQHGGGLFSASNDSVILDETMQIYGNEARTGHGGGIYMGGNGLLTMIYGSIHSNRAPNGDGGAIYRSRPATGTNTAGANVILNGGIIRDNTARRGAGIFFNANHNAGTGAPASPHVNNTLTIGGMYNTGTAAAPVWEMGTALNANGQVIPPGVPGGTAAQTAPMPAGTTLRRDIFGITIENNMAEYDGGGIFMNTGELFINNGAVNNNRARNGGGVYFRATTANPPRFTMAGQQALIGNIPHPGGVIARNEATASGGGVFVSNLEAPATHASTFTMQNGIINDNLSATSGGGIYVGGRSHFNLAGGSVGSEITRIIYGAMDDPIPYDAQLVYNRDPVTGEFIFTNPGTGASASGPSMKDSDGNWIREFVRDVNGNIIFDEDPNTGELIPRLGDYIFASFTYEVFSGNMAGFQLDAIGEPEEVAPDARGGGVYFNSSGIFNLTGINPVDPGGAVENNISTGHGGGVFVTDVSPNTQFNLVRGTFRNNHAINGSGGGIYMGVGNLSVGEHINIMDNSAGGHGGGVFFASNGSVGIADGGISSNIAGGHGGGVYIANNIDFNMTGGTIGGEREVPTTLDTTFTADIREKWVTINEGTDDEEDVPVFVVASDIMYTIEDLLFGGNMAGFITREVEIDGLTQRRIFNNPDPEYAQASGGGLYLRSVSGATATFNMTGGSVENNIARGHGGGVYIPANVTMESMTNADISFNRAGFGVRDEAEILYGAGSYRDAGCGNTNCRDYFCQDRNIVPSNPDSHGGGIYLSPVGAVAAGNFDMYDSSVSYNIAHGHGGSIWIDRVSDFVMRGNSAINGNETITGNGGGVFFVPTAGGAGTFIMESGTIDGNRARSPDPDYGKGGGVYISEGITFRMPASDVIRTINHNEARLGGGIFVTSGGVLDIENNLNPDVRPDNIQINHNRALQSGGGIYFEQNNDFTMRYGISINYNLALGGSGGGVFFAPDSNSSFTMVSGRINGNMSYSHGGGLFIPAGVNIIGHTVGSTLAANGSQLRTQINGNRAGFTLSEPAIDIKVTEQIVGEIDGMDIIRRTLDTFINRADIIVGDVNAMGGGIYLASTGATSSVNPFRISQSSISGNASTGSGGGIWIDRNLGFNLDAISEISGNTAGVGLDGKTIVNPQADGGGVHFTTVGAAPSTFTMADGAGVGARDVPVVIEREEIEDVITIIPGRPGRPAIGDRPAQMSRQRQIIVDRVVTTTREAVGGNRAARHGGGVYFGPVGNGVFEMEGGLGPTFFGNEAMLGHGGGLHFAPRSAGISKFDMRVGTIGADAPAVRSVITYTTNRSIAVNRMPGMLDVDVYDPSEVHENIAVGVTDGAAVNMELCRRNIADNGGGVYFNPAGNDSKISICSDAAIEYNVARISAGSSSVAATSGSGGGLYVNRGILILAGGNISGNIAQTNGGGLFLAAQAALQDDTIIDTQIDNNMAGFILNSGVAIRSARDGFGGGVYFEVTESDAQETLIIGGDSEISGNEAGGDGGGIWLVRFDEVILNNNVEINENAAGRYGGGIFFAPGSGTLTINNNVTINGNASAQDGGGVYLGSGELVINDGLINDNTAENHGGGVYISDAQVVMNGGTIGTNQATRGGGVYLAEDGLFTMDIYTGSVNNDEDVGFFARIGRAFMAAFRFVASIFDSDESDVSDGGIIDNISEQRGGGVYIEDGAAFAMLDGRVSGNISEQDGGGIYVEFAGSVILEAGYMTDNSAIEGDGGAIFTDNHEYINPLSVDGIGAALYYRNLNISLDITFDGNSAWSSFSPPVNALTTGIPDSSQSINMHPLNNYDINFMPEVLLLRFFKTDMDIYTNPNDAEFLYYALFHLYDSNNMLVATQHSDSNGLVFFTYEFSMNVQYRLIEQSAPEGYVRPTGYWIITIDEFGTKTIVEQGGNHAFEDIDGALHVGNERIYVDFELHKTGQNIYDVPQWGDANWIDSQLRQGAHFSLFLYTGTGEPACGVITDTMIAAGTWIYVDSDISSGVIDSPMTFELIPGRHYHLIETTPPTGYILPLGEWRIIAIIRDSDEEAGFRIRYQGDSTVPAFVNIILPGGTSNPQDEDYNAHFGGTFFVGNRPILILPMSGAAGAAWLLMVAGLLLILTAFGFAIWRIKKSARGYMGGIKL